MGVQNMAIRNYRDLLAWQKAMDLVEAGYQLTRRFPKEETFALTSQLRRALTSVPSNIAEGEGRGSRAEFSRFLSIAHGSLREAETQLLIAHRLNYLSEPELASALELAAETGRLIQGLRRSLNRNPKR
jgi:four helix bundle protein